MSGMDTYADDDALRLRTMPASNNLGAVLNVKDYAIGIVMLFTVVLLWTASNFLTQHLLEGGYEKPFFVTYMNTSSFIIYLVPYLMRGWWSRRGKSEAGKDGRHTNYPGEYEPLVGTDEPSTEAACSPSPRSTIHRQSDAVRALTERETADLAFVFCFVWFIANWAVNASLDYTSVASATILTSVSGFLTLGIGRLYRVEKLTLIKIAAVSMSFIGVILVSLSDASAVQQPSLPRQGKTSDHARCPTIGDVLALISALFYAIYVVLLKVRIQAEARIDMQLFFGFVGLFNVLTCWPIGIVLHLLGVEKLGFPSSGKTWTNVLINMVITLSSDYLYVLAMLKTTPLVVTIGLSLTIPVAVLGDFMLGRTTETQVIVGAAFILTSFFAVGIWNDEENVEEHPQL